MNNPPIPVVPKWAIQLASRLEGNRLPGEVSIRMSVDRIFPNIELADKWEIMRAFLMMHGKTPDQLQPL